MYSIGVDIGGMSVKIGLVDENGKILKKGRTATDVAGGADKIVSDIAKVINELVRSDDGELSGIGIGCPGTITSATGVVDRAYNLNWENVALADKLYEHIKKPIKVSNDANVAALGETMFGVGKNYTDTVLLTLGTGVGGGVIIDGALYEGAFSKGAELGHMVVAVDGEKCSCGRRGCLEAYCSATALIRDTKAAMLGDKTSAMWKFSPDIDQVDGRTAFECSKQGDAAATKVVDDYVKYLAEGMMNFANIFRPQAIILGGGVSAQGKYLTDKLDAYCKARDYGFAGAPVFDILVAKLGNDAGIIGAAALLF